MHAWLKIRLHRQKVNRFIWDGLKLLGQATGSKETLSQGQ
jgi:hypothetical protein